MERERKVRVSIGPDTHETRAVVPGPEPTGVGDHSDFATGETIAVPTTDEVRAPESSGNRGNKFETADTEVLPSGAVIANPTDRLASEVKSSVGDDGAFDLGQHLFTKYSTIAPREYARTLEKAALFVDGASVDDIVEAVVSKSLDETVLRRLQEAYVHDDNTKKRDFIEQVLNALKEQVWPDEFEQAA